MVRINTNTSSIPELLHKRAQEGRGHVWHPNKIHSEKAWTCLKMESSATKVWFGQSKKSYIVRGNLLWFSAANFCVFFRNSFPKLRGKVTLALPPSFPLEFLHLEELLMTYWSVHVVIGASALALRYARGLIFFSISSASNFRGGLPKESLRLDQSFQNNLMKTDFSCRAFWISMPLVTLWTQISLRQ